MARLIIKSPYIKCGGGQNASGYLQYIATRERVEIVPDDRPPTRKQEQLIQKLAKDFPDAKELLEYNDYTNAPTKANASSFITLTLEQNWSRVQSTEGYAKYIATRPRAERLGSHGLFGDADPVSLNAAMDELSHYTGNVWTHIISLKREDAARLGYDNAAAWQALLRAHRNDIAAAMSIDPKDFRWYAAFHNEGNHPHVHMMAWSAKPGQAYLDRNGIKEIKSVLTNEIFQQELLHLYETKSTARDELVHQTRQAMLELAQRMRDGLCICPDAEKGLWELSQKMNGVQGKKVYGYLPKPMKQLVDKVVDAMEKLPVVNECYQNGGSCNAGSTTTIPSSSGSVHRCHSKRNFGKSRTRSSVRQSISAKVECPSRTQPRRRKMKRQMTATCPMTVGSCGKSLLTKTCPWRNGTVLLRSWSRLPAKATPTPNTLWACCTVTAACWYQTQSRQNTGWSCRRRSYQTPNMSWESCTSQMIQIYTIPQKVSTGCNKRWTAGTSTPPTVWARSI